MIDLGDQFYLADASDKFLAHNHIPPRAINHKGLIIDKEGASWVDLERMIPAQDKKNIKIEVHPESLKAQVSMTIESKELKAY